MHSENKSKRLFFFPASASSEHLPMRGLLRCLAFVLLALQEIKNKIKYKIIKESSNLDIHQPGKQTLPAKRSPTIVKKIDKTKSTYDDPTTVLLGNL